MARSCRSEGECSGESTTNTLVDVFPVSNGRRLKTCHAVLQTNVELGKSVHRMLTNPCAANSTDRRIENLSASFTRNLLRRISSALKFQPRLAQLWDQLYRSSTRRGSQQKSSLSQHQPWRRSQNYPGRIGVSSNPVNTALSMLYVYNYEEDNQKKDSINNTYNQL